MALDRALVQQRKRHIANDDLNHAKAVQKATNVDEEDAKRREAYAQPEATTHDDYMAALRALPLHSTS